MKFVLTQDVSALHPTSQHPPVASSSPGATTQHFVREKCGLHAVTKYCLSNVKLNMTLLEECTKLLFLPKEAMGLCCFHTHINTNSFKVLWENWLFQLSLQIYCCGCIVTKYGLFSQGICMGALLEQKVTLKNLI